MPKGNPAGYLPNVKKARQKQGLRKQPVMPAKKWRSK